MNSFKISIVLVALFLLSSASAFACSAHSGGSTDSSQSHDGDKPANG